MNKTFIIARYGIDGGTGTLSIRMTKWLTSNGYKVVYMCCENDNESNFNELIKNSATIVTDSDRTYKNHFQKTINTIDEYIVITYSFEEYLSVTKQKNIHENVRKVFCYVVHGLMFGNIIETTSFINRLKKLYRCFYLRDYIRRIYLNGDLFFMDEDSVDKTQRILYLDFPNIEKSILRLPMEINDYRGDFKIKNVGKKEPFTILTISRMEFPFKGYILGLINAYVSLKEKGFNIKLIIIGDGLDRNIVIEKINDLNENIRQGIQLISRVPYSMLGKYFKLSKLYIGMGTTILDAVNNSIPALAVDAYTYNLVNISRFDKNPGSVGCIADSSEYSCNSLSSIEELIKMNNKEYQDLVYSQHCALKKMYDINNFFQLLINREVGEFDLYKHSFLRFKVLKFPKIISFVRLIIDKKMLKYI